MNFLYVSILSFVQEPVFSIFDYRTQMVVLIMKGKDVK